MIYFDNSATTLMKPSSIKEALVYAIDNFGNPSRSINECALLATREIYKTRVELARLVELENPLKIAFTSGATESLNLIINGLIDEKDHVITTELEHNSVLRPLYNSGCEISFVKLNDSGEVIYSELDSLIQSNTKALICTHASNVIGNILNTKLLYEFTQKNQIYFILDVSQSLGSIEVRADMADIICFTGHKSLFGPQGTGGIIMMNDIPTKITKTGGAGSNSFAVLQSSQMPDIFEVGTPNSHGIYGLQQGIKFINEIELEKISEYKTKLTKYFYQGLKEIAGLKIYGSSNMNENVGVVAINYRDINSSDFSEKLYDKYDIATRSQSHCAPLLHEFFDTKEQGMVRFSFSYFNTINEIDICLKAINEIIEEENK